MRLRMGRWWVALVSVALAGPAHAMTFTPGHLYASGGSLQGDLAINEYDAAGNLLSSMTPPPPISAIGGEARGMAFGPDGNLYVVRAAPTFGDPAFVQALRSDGSVVRSYSLPASISSNAFLGRIAFDPTGDRFYVATGLGVYRFEGGSTTGSLFIDAPAIDVEVLPNGELLVGGGDYLYHYSSSGEALSSFSLLSDPLGLTDLPDPRLYFILGVEYDPSTNSTFVSAAGYTGLFDHIFRLDGFTNVITGLGTLTGGPADLYLTDARELLVGSRLLPARFSPTTLSSLGAIGTQDRAFVTEMPVPEPGAALLVLTPLTLTMWRTRWRPLTPYSRAA